MYVSDIVLKPVGIVYSITPPSHSKVPPPIFTKNNRSDVAFVVVCEPQLLTVVIVHTKVRTNPKSPKPVQSIITLLASTSVNVNAVGPATAGEADGVLVTLGVIVLVGVTVGVVVLVGVIVGVGVGELHVAHPSILVATPPEIETRWTLLPKDK